MREEHKAVLMSSEPSDPDYAEDSATPERSVQAVWLNPVTRPGIRVKSPLIHVVVTDDDQDGVYVVSDKFSTVYGAGETVDAAMREYIENLFLQFDELDRDEDHLGVRLQAELHTLRQYFARED